MPLRVLLVEDDPADAELTTIRLQRGLEPRFPGMSIEVAESLSEGIRKAHQIRPHIAVLDLSLPDSDPAQALAGFRQMVPGIPALSYSGVDSADVLKNGDDDGLCARVSGLVDLSVDEISEPEIIVAELEKPSAKPPADKGPLWRRGLIFFFKNRSDVVWATVTLLGILGAATGYAKDEVAGYVHDQHNVALGDPTLKPGECVGEGDDRRCGPKKGSNADKWLARLVEQESKIQVLGEQVARNTTKLTRVDNRTSDMVFAMGSDKCMQAGGAPVTIKVKVDLPGGDWDFEEKRLCRWWGERDGTVVKLDEVPLYDLAELDARIAANAEKAAIKAAKKAAKKAVKRKRRTRR